MAETKTKSKAKPARSTRASRAAKEEPGSKSGIKFTYDDGLELVLDTNGLTIRERIEVEEALGMPFAEAVIKGWMLSDKASAVLAHITRRREEPGFALSDVLDSTSLEVELGVDPPTTPEANGKKD